MHVDIVIDLNVKDTSSNVLTRAFYLTIQQLAREVIDWLLFCVNSKEQAERKHCRVDIVSEGKDVDDEELP